MASDDLVAAERVEVAAELLHADGKEEAVWPDQADLVGSCSGRQSDIACAGSVLELGGRPGGSDAVSVRQGLATRKSLVFLVLLALLVPPWGTSAASPTPVDGSVLFSIPVGPGGVTYSGGHLEQQAWGPAAIAADRDGTIWVADTAADPDNVC